MMLMELIFFVMNFKKNLKSYIYNISIFVHRKFWFYIGISIFGSTRYLNKGG